MIPAAILVERKLNNFKFWIVFLFYSIILFISEINHEPWGDELQTWNLIKGSENLSSLFLDARYDGHPPLWYFLVFVFSKLWHSLYVLKVVAFLFCCSTTFVLVFYSRFNLTITTLILSGYYFLFEYALFSRNYAIVVFISFLLCVVLSKEKKISVVFYYILLFLLSNSHLLSLFLAFGFHVYFLRLQSEKKMNRKSLILHGVIGLLIISSGLVYVYSGTDLSSGLSNSLSTWDKGRLVIAAQVPLRAFITIPIWWNYNFWNTNAIWELSKYGLIGKFAALFISLTLIVVVFKTLRKSNKALIFFGGVLIPVLVLAIITPMTNARYVGFIYLAFLISLWLNWQDLGINPKNKILIYILLILQIPGSVIALSRDWTSNFSQVDEVKNIVSQMPNKNNLITDYWGLNFLNAVYDQGYYCVESKEEQSFLVLNKHFVDPLWNNHRYTQGTKYYFLLNKCKNVYFITNLSPIGLDEIDTNFNKFFLAKLVTAKIGAIEKFSDLYLYKISPRNF